MSNLPKNIKHSIQIITYLILPLITSNLIAQTGPAGIGNSDGTNGQPKLEYWFDASDLALTNGDPVAAWSDKSGNGNDISQAGIARPTFRDATDPGYNFSAVSFDGTDDFFPIDGSLLVNSNYTLVIVGTRKSGGREVILGGSATTGNQNFHPYFNTNALHSHQYGNDHNAPYATGAGRTANATSPDFGVFGFRLNADLGTAHRALYQNGAIIGTRNDNRQLTAYPDAAIARYTAEFSDIEIAEIIIYSDALDEAQMAIVSNHLSAKYNLPMNNNELYAGDTPANGDFDFSVGGIGQLNSSQVLEGNSVGFYVTADASLDVDGEFVLVGEDNTANAVSTANVDASVQARWAKSWFLDKTTAGTLSAELSFDIREGISGGQFPGGDKNNYVLLRDNAGTFDIVPLANADKSVVGSKIVFNVADADLVDGVYTLGTLDNTDSPILGVANQTWYTRKTGDWTDPTVWTLDGAANPGVNNPLAELPDPTDNVVINNGDLVTMVDNDRVVTSIEVSGVLDIGATSGHDFTTISGNGTIRLSGAAGIGNFPAGNTNDFANNFIGGTVEYYGGGLTITESRTFNNVIVSLTNPANELILMNDLQLNGDLTIQSGVFQINDDASTVIKTVEVEGDLFVNNNGAIAVGQGDTKGAFTIVGNVMPATGNYHDIFHQVILKGDFNNQGTVRFTNQTAPVYNEFTSTGAATVRFEGATNNIANLSGITDFYNLIINKGTDQTYELEISSNSAANFQLYGPNSVGRIGNGGFTAENPEVRKALWLYSGTLHLTGNLEIPTLSEGNQNGGNGDYPIGANAGLWIDGVNVAVFTTADNTTQIPVGASGINTGGSNQALSLYGKFTISDGFFGTRGSAGFIFWNATAGEVLIEGGTVNVSQFRSAQSGNSTYSYTQTGGDVLVRANEGVPGETSGTYDLFSLDIPEAVFNMSGGTLTVYGNQSNAIFIGSKPGNFNVTGGDVIVENRNGNIATIASTAPFWNLTLKKDQAGDAGEIDLITCTSGVTTLTNPDLVILNNFTIETGITFDHNGNDVTVGSDFTVALGATYVYDDTKRSTLTLNGVDNSTLALLNIAGGGAANEVQRFYNLTINKPHGKVIDLASSKSGGNFNGFQNNLFRVDGEAFKLLSGTLDQGRHSILINCDTLLNYDILTIYNESLGTSGANNIDANANGNNDQIKLASNQGGPTDITLITADTAVIGNLKFFMQNFIVDLNSDLTIQYLEHNNGRFNLQDNNLKVTFYNQNVPGGAGSIAARGLTNMIVTDGKGSDGGFSLAINGNTSYTFPMGIGLTGASPASKYTPATVTVTNFSDNGFITIRPVDQLLATTDGSGGDILSYYWKVAYEGFTAEPNVQYQFTYNQSDLDGSVNEGLFVAGKVLEIAPYTRRFEDDNITGVPGSIQNEGVNAGTNVITFNGDADNGFLLEEAAYTAGESARFVGAPQIFYSRNTTPTNWTNGSAWSLTRDGAAAGDYPRDGDIAILTRDNGGAGDPTGYGAGVFTITNAIGAINIAKLVFDDFDPINNNWISGCPRVTFDVSGGYNAYDSFFGSVEVTDRHIGGPTPNNSHGAVIQYNLNTSYPGNFPGGDFGNFNSYENALVIYAWDGGTGTVTLSAAATEYPMLWFQGGNSNNRFFQFPDVDVTVNGRANINGGMRILVNDDASRTLRFRNNVEVGSGCCGQGFFEFEGNSTGNQTVIIEGDLSFNPTNGGQIRLINNSATNTHKLILSGNITVPASGTMNLGNGTQSVVNLELQGATNNTFTNLGSVILHRLIVNKGTSKANRFTFNDTFTINGATNGAIKAITIQNGTLVFNDPAINVNLSTGGPSFNIPSTGGLWLTQGTANVSGDDSGILLDGSIIVDGGTLDMSGAGNGNNFIEYSASGSAVIDISSGNLTVGSQIRGNTITTSGVLNYTQTGGDVVVGASNYTYNAAASSRGVFEIKNTGSNFTYTAGTLTLVRQNGTAPTVAALRILPSNYNITQPIYIGNGNTPINQSDFGINSSVPLAGLVISGNNSPTAVTKVNALTLDGELLINNGATLNANGIGLTLNSDFTNNGTFLASGNTTTFASGTSQILGGNNLSTFFKFTKLNDAILEIDNNNNGIVVTDLFSHEAGSINNNGATIDLKSNAVIEGDLSSSGSEGLKFSGSIAQQLQRLTAGMSTLGVVTISNPAGVIIPESNGFNFLIEGDLQMNGGIFNIGSSDVTLGQNSEVTTNGTFSETNMVKTNSSFADNGLTKTFTAGYNQVFVFPVGELDYTPVTFDFSITGGTSGSTVGTISARPANEPHPTIDDGNEFYATDVNNVLQYYWTLRSSTINNLVADVSFNYDQSAVLTEDAAVTESTYISARILAFNNIDEEINKFTIDEVDEATNTISFPAALAFNGASSNTISGDYFAGDDDAIPDRVVTYVSQNTGGSVASSATFVDGLITDGVAPSGAVLVVSSGTEVTFDVLDVQLYKTIIESGGVLNIDNTDGHRLGIVEGTGDLKLTTDFPNVNANLPPADYGSFFSCTGGGLEYAGTGTYTIMAAIPNNSVRRLTLSDPTGTGVRNFANANYTICEDLIIDGPSVNSPFSGNINIINDLIINSGSFNTNGSKLAVFGTTQVLGGEINGVSNNKEFYGPVVINGGVFRNGSAGLTIFRNDLSLISGSFIKGVGSNRTLFTGNGQTITGDFTGVNSFGGVVLNTPAATSVLNLGGNVEISGLLDLRKGLLVSNGNDLLLGPSATVTPVKGRSISYVTGKVTKEITSAGGSFTFPIGSTAMWRPAVVKNVSTGGLTWEAQFWNREVVANTIATTGDPTDPAAIVRLQLGEYWIISDGNAAPSGVTANVGLSWGTETDVSANPTERQELQVMVWNAGSDSWDELGGGGFSGGNTQSQGSFESTATASFSENIFIVGSGDAANPLPVELVSFTAKIQNNAVQLDWVTATEKDNDFFEVQRSFDGQTFETIGIVEGNGTVSYEVEYGFRDVYPLNGRSYYRLKQNDYDGNFEFSPIVTVVMEVASNLRLFPNPTTDQAIYLTLDGFHQSQDVYVKIFNLQGRNVYEEVLSPEDLYRKPLPIREALNPGIYIVEVNQGNTMKQVRLAIQ